MARGKRILSGVLVLVVLAALAGGWRWWRDYRWRHPVVRDIPRHGGLDVTLLALSDLHFGSKVRGRAPGGGTAWVDAMPVRREIERQMRGIAGKPWPEPLRGKVGDPAALLIAGDLTQDGKVSEWEEFASFYRIGQPIGYGIPIYETYGNHDQHTGTFVPEKVNSRHGGRYYSLDFGDLHIASLSDGPDMDGLAWLERDLAATGRERPVILFTHYPLLGPWSGSWFGWNKPVTERFAGIVGRFNVIAILHGHYHVPGYYQWRGTDVFNIGSIQHGARCFGVIRVTDSRFTYACWNSEKNAWWWWFSKPINGSAGETGTGLSSSGGLLSVPAIPYPVDKK